MRDSLLFDRVYGCLLGGAVGDALGFPTEGRHYASIRRDFGRVTGPMVREGGESMRPRVTTCRYTDDTEMKHMVCRAIFRSDGHPTIENLAAEWRETIRDPTEWLWWNNTRIVHAKLMYNPLLPLEEAGRDSIPGDDAAMIIAPVGLLNAGYPEQAIRDTWRVMPLIQHGYSIEVAAALAAAYAVAVVPGASVQDVLRCAWQSSPSLRPGLDRGLELVNDVRSDEDFTERFYAGQLDFPNNSFWNSIGPPPDWSFNADPLEVAVVALCFLALSGGDAERAILGAVNFGRDADTIAGIAGAFCGALNGVRSLPEPWRARVLADNPEPEIADYAERLCNLIVRDYHARSDTDVQLRMMF